MVVVRLARGGAKKRPFYSIVVSDSRSPRDGRFIEKIGYANPVACGQEKRIKINMDRLDHWRGQGAQLSSTVKRLVREHRRSPLDSDAKANKVAAKSVAQKPVAKAKPAESSSSEANTASGSEALPVEAESTSAS